jgi:hypothetical protein
MNMAVFWVGAKCTPVEVYQYFRGVSKHLPELSGVPCHHGMARPHIAVGGDDLQIWRVAANIFNKQ